MPYRADFAASFPQAMRELHGSSFVRIVRELRYGDQAIGCTDLGAVVVRTEVLDGAEAVASEQHSELFTFPTAHDEPIIAHVLVALSDKFVTLGYQQEPMFSVELGDAREGQLPPIS